MTERERAATFPGRRSLTIALAIMGGLAGCSSSDDNTFQRVGALAKASFGGTEKPEPKPERTRAQLNEIPFATIALTFDEGQRTFMVPLSDNGGYLNYLDASSRGLVMFGGAVSGTKALGQDITAVRHQSNDPIAFPTPMLGWPGQVYRDYQFTQRSGAEYSITLSCVFERLVNETIEIVEIKFDVVRISEVCTNARRQVTNTYWVEADTGFIWKSEQWLGPHIDQATIEIIRPYSG